MARSRDDDFRSKDDDFNFDDRSRRRRDDDDRDYDEPRSRRRRDDDEDDYEDVSRRVRSNSRGNDADDNMQPIDWVLAIVCSGIGCIMGIIYLAQGKKKGGTMLAVSLVFIVIWNVVRFGLMAASGQLR